jgi:hypothetical protein
VISVSPDYVHVRKQLSAGEQLGLPQVRLKWYDLHRQESPIPAEVDQEARKTVQEQISDITPLGELGFVINHRVGDAYLLLVCSWLGDNELWETVYFKDKAGFEPMPFPKTAKATYCVWEMGAVLHEQEAWINYLFSDRDEAAREAYLADTHPGGVI